MTALDREQAEVVSIDPSTRQVVVAGPGSGKTHVVSHLVERLVMDEGLDPVRGVLVLSFSNAAVHAVQARMRGRDVPPVPVRTIDSLASRVVRDCTDDEVERMSFEDRIRRGTELVLEGEWDDLEDVDHLVVDEVQDVVGVRADFVLALLRSMRPDAGATLLGDPAQAIYDFQLAAEGGGTTSADLLAAVRTDGARNVVLNGQYRASSRDAKGAVALRQPGTDEADPYDVEDYWNDVVHAGSVTDAWGVLKTRGGTTAYLTATNGQALLVAQELRSAGARVAVQRGAQDQSLAAWIGVVMESMPGNSVSKEDFSRALGVADPTVDADVAWRALRSVAGARGRELDKVALATRLTGRTTYPPELRAQADTQAVVSTVHRAKGLEFDHVVLVDFASQRGLDEDEAYRARTRFVAVTRAKDLIMKVLGPPDRDVVRPKARPPARPRWIRSGRQSWQTFGFELHARDVDAQSPLGAGDEVQSLLRTPSIVDTEVRLEPSPELSTLRLPVFTIETSLGRLGVTAEGFGVDLVGRIGNLEKQRRGWPSLRGVHVEEIATVVDEASRFRLIPVLTGLADIEWSHDSD